MTQMGSRMGKNGTGDPWSGLVVGKHVIVSSLVRSRNELPSKITKISAQGCQLQSTRSTTGFSLQKNEEVRVKYTEEGILYSWDGKVDKISGPENQSATISIHNVGVTVDQRASLRLNTLVPFSFMIVDATETKIISEQLVKSNTRNISTVGLSFESDLPLTEGDHLQLSIQVSPTQSVNFMGWVVRCEAAQEDSKKLVAVEFLQPEKKEERLLRTFLAKLSG